MFSKKTPCQKMLKKMTPTDMGLIKLSMISLGLLIASYFPQAAEVDPMIYLFVFIILAIKPLILWLK